MLSNDLFVSYLTVLRNYCSCHPSDNFSTLENTLGNYAQQLQAYADSSLDILEHLRIKLKDQGIVEDSMHMDWNEPS